MNIRVGLFPHSAVWQEFCEQEGVPVLPAVTGLPLDVREFSMVVVTRAPDPGERECIAAYLRDGGAVLGYAGFLDGIAGIETREHRIEYLLPDAEHIPSCGVLLDIGMKGAIPREARHWRTQDHQHAVSAGPLLGGAHIALPFDPAPALTDIRHADKSFYAQRDRLPAERVSLVSKGAVRFFLHRAFEYLHHVRGIPYCHLWWYPARCRSVFAMRIDTDAGSRQEIESLYRIARDFGIGMSWYLDVKSHEPWLGYFSTLAGQELGVHCYEHRPFSQYDEIHRDLAKAKRLMESLGLRPEGVTAPYGRWSEEFARAVDDLRFEYSSEFSLAYDSLPFVPRSRGDSYAALQVPIHPVCVGSLLRVGYDEEGMRGYFDRVIREKLARHEPVFLYHHPSHRSWHLIRYICSRMEEEGVPSMTLGEYAAWWKRRAEKRFAAAVEGNRLQTRVVVGTGATEETLIRVTRAGGEEALLVAAPEVDLQSVAWSSTLPYLPPEDLRRIREFDPRSVLGSLYSSIQRRRR